MTQIGCIWLTSGLLNVLMMKMECTSKKNIWASLVATFYLPLSILAEAITNQGGMIWNQFSICLSIYWTTTTYHGTTLKQNTRSKKLLLKSCFIRECTFSTQSDYLTWYQVSQSTIKRLSEELVEPLKKILTLSFEQKPDYEGILQAVRFCLNKSIVS